MRLIIVLLLVLIAAATSATGFLLAISDPSTETLNSDIATISRELKAAEAESAKYSGGLIKVLIDLRAQTLRSTETILQQKRLSVLRRIDLVVNVDGRALLPIKDLSGIESDIKGALLRVAAADAKAQLYSGGLVQVLALTTAATERVTLAQLHLAYYCAKYALPCPDMRTSAQEPPPPTGNVVKDKDAL